MNDTRNIFKNLFLLRFALAVILLMHGLTSIFGDITGFGAYLNDSGFKPFGLVLAWLIKLSQVAAAIGLLINRYVKLLGFITIFILLTGILMVHLKNGWFVVGGGSNGVEYNFLLIIALLTVMYPHGIKRS